ncbi:MAG: DUF177 domain-containing protein [Anaerolineales bacterium]
MLAFNVAQLLKEGVGATRHHPLAGELYDLDEANPGHRPVDGYIDLVRTPKGVLVQGRANLVAQATCRRCLVNYARALELEVEEEYVATIDVVTGYRIELEDDDEPELQIDEHHILDTREVLRQYAVAALTEWGLCRPDCKGLCPTCGVDLNVETCHCHLVKVDPRLAALAGLLGTQDQK